MGQTEPLGSSWKLMTVCICAFPWTIPVYHYYETFCRKYPNLNSFMLGDMCNMYCALHWVKHGTRMTVPSIWRRLSHTWSKQINETRLLWNHGKTSEHNFFQLILPNVFHWIRNAETSRGVSRNDGRYNITYLCMCRTYSVFVFMLFILPIQIA